MEPLSLDDTSWKILKGLTYTSKTPQMLSRIYGIPIAECWKRIHHLEGLGVVRVVLTFVTTEGHVLSFYEVAGTVVVEEDAQVYFQPTA